MAQKTSTLHCTRCGHRWSARYDQPPEVCPRCKSRKWNDPVPEGEGFLRKVEAALDREVPPDMRKFLRACFDFYRSAPPARVALVERIMKEFAG